MNAYVTSIGEKTTDICCEQLRRYGFNVILLDKKESWVDKYKRFINMAEGNCLRVDADVIVNSKIKMIHGFQTDDDYLLVDFHTYDFYKNDLSVSAPVYYKAEAIKMIKERLDEIEDVRPEATLSRKVVGSRKGTSELIVGMHGFFQTEDHLHEAEANKIKRGQIEKYGYDFRLAEKMLKL